MALAEVCGLDTQTLGKRSTSLLAPFPHDLKSLASGSFEPLEQFSLPRNFDVSNDSRSVVGMVHVGQHDEA